MGVHLCRDATDHKTHLSRITGLSYGLDRSLFFKSFKMYSFGSDLVACLCL